VIGVSLLVVGVCLVLLSQNQTKKMNTPVAQPSTTAPPATKKPYPTQAPILAPTAMIGPVEISMWYPITTGSEEEKNALQGLVDSYTQLHPNVTVNLEFIDSTKLADLTAEAYAAGQPPDLALTFASEIRKLISAGQIIPLDAYVGGGKLDHFLPIALENSTIEGYVYVLPDRMFSMGLWYNKKMISEPPATTDGLLKLVKDGNRIIIFQVSYFLFGFLTTQGGTVDLQTGACSADRTGLVDAVRYLKQLKDAGAVFTSDYSQMDTEFNQEIAAMTVNGSWSLNTYSTALGENLGVAPIPAGKTPARPLTDIYGYVISRTSPNPSAAADLALYLTGADAVTQMTDTVGSLPSRDDVTSRMLLMNDFVRIAQQGLPVVPAEDKLEQFYIIGDQVIPSVLDGSVSLEDAVKKVCQAVGGS